MGPFRRSGAPIIPRHVTGRSRCKLTKCRAFYSDYGAAKPLGQLADGRPSRDVERVWAVQWVHSDAAAPLSSPGTSLAGHGVNSLSVGPTTVTMARASPLGQLADGRPSRDVERVWAVQTVPADAAAPLSSPGEVPVTGRSRCKFQNDQNSILVLHHRCCIPYFPDLVIIMIPYTRPHIIQHAMSLLYS